MANSLSRRGFSSLVLPDRKSKNPIGRSVGDHALAGEELARLLERRVGGGQHDVGGDDLVVRDARAGARDLGLELLEQRVEPLVAVAVERGHDLVVDGVQPLALLVGHPPLALARDAHDHGFCSSAAVGSAASPAWPVAPAAGSAASPPVPWPSSRFMRSRSESTPLVAVSLAISRSRSVVPLPGPSEKSS